MVDIRQIRQIDINRWIEWISIREYKRIIREREYDKRGIEWRWLIRDWIKRGGDRCRIKRDK